jgi:hypothetical protein
MRSSMQLTLLSLLSCVVHGFSSPAILPLHHTTSTSKNGLLHRDRLRLVPRGGANKLPVVQRFASSSPAATGSKCPATGAATIAASIWGAGGVIYILAKAIKRVIPIALEPFQAGAIPLTNFQLGYE